MNKFIVAVIVVLITILLGSYWFVQTGRWDAFGGGANRYTISAPYVLTFGDSISNGAQGDGNLSAANFCWRDDLQSLLNVTRFRFVGRFKSPYRNKTYGVRTSAYYGQRTDQQKAYVGSDLDKFMPAPVPANSSVLIHLGTNDVIQGVARSTAVGNIMDMVNLIDTHDPEIQVFVALVIPTATGANNNITLFNADLNASLTARIATKGNLHIVNCNQAFLNHTGWKDDYLQADGVHPTDAGHAVIAQEFYNALKTE